MAKKQRKKKNSTRNIRAMFEKLFSMHKLILFVLLFAVISSAAAGGYYFLTHSEFFKIKEVVANWTGSNSRGEAVTHIGESYKGRNMFSIDIYALARTLKKEHPYLKDVEVRRLLPDRIEIDMIERVPVAVISSGDGVVIDQDAIVLPISSYENNLVKIEGIRFFFSTPDPGEKIRTAPVLKALQLLRAISGKNFTDKRTIDYIDVSDKNNVILKVSGILVKMGNDNFAWKINKLNEILQDSSIDPRGINYIDLRFDDVVISPK